MEAVWTRYFPLSIYVREQVTSGRLGQVSRTTADLSFPMDPEKSFADGKHRMVNLDLAGGALLDLGIYALTWVFQTLYTTQSASDRKAPSVVAAMKPTFTGADEQTTMLLTFPRGDSHGGNAHGIATCSMKLATDPDKKGSAGPAVRVQGSLGELDVYAPIFRPTRTRLVLADGTVEDKTWTQPGPGAGSGWKNGFGDIAVNPEGEGHGMFWEADEVARALSEGRKEGQYESLEESVVIMEVMDEVRRQGGLKYPAKIETTDYPTEL